MFGKIFPDTSRRIMAASAWSGGGGLQMRSVVAFDRGVSASVFWPMLRRLLLPGFAIVALLGSQPAFAQQNPTSLPEIQVIGTTPLPPVRPAAAPASRAS